MKNPDNEQLLNAVSPISVFKSFVTPNVIADGDPNEMAESTEPVGPLDGKFQYKKEKDGTINKHVVKTRL